MQEIYEAWRLMILASNEIASPAFMYDLVDITRQALVNTGNEILRCDMI